MSARDDYPLSYLGDGVPHVGDFQYQRMCDEIDMLRHQVFTLENERECLVRLEAAPQAERETRSLPRFGDATEVFKAANVRRPR